VSAEPGEPSPPETSPLGARLSPFVFPSDTTFRFLLLLVAVIGANLYIWNWLWITIGVDRGDQANAYFACFNESQSALAVATTDAAQNAARSAYTECLQATNQPLAKWMIGGTVLLLAVAALIVVLTPFWIRKRRKLRPLTHADAPTVVAELATLARESGIREEPTWLWNPLDPSPTGLAFGRPGKHSVALMGGLVTRQFADPPAFRAVVRHELAHLRNRDVSITYATVSLWYAFLLVGVLPFALAVLDEGIETILRLTWRLLALAVLVYLSRNAVLRAREVYADVRASVPDGPQGALRRILGALPTGSASVWRRLWRVHPDPQARLASVNDTRRLFPIGLLVAFGTGVASTIALDSLVTLLGIYVADTIQLYMLSAAVFAPLAMGAIGVGIWRTDWGALAEKHATPPTWQLALALGFGFVVGPELALQRIVRLEDDETLLGSALGSGAPWIAALLVGLVLLLAWVSGSAQAWLRALAGSTRPTLATSAGLLLGSGMLAMFVGVFFALHATAPIIEVSRNISAFQYSIVSQTYWVGPQWLWQLVNDNQTLSILNQPIVFAALVAIWLFPLAAWTRRRKEIGKAEWAFLEPGGQLRTPPLGRVPLEPWLIGVAGGIVSFLAYIALRLWVHADIDPESRVSTTFAFAFAYWMISIALLAQLVVAIVTVARVREFRLVSGLAAAFTTAVIAAISMELMPSIGSCVEPLSIRSTPCGLDISPHSLWFYMRWMAAEGAIVALAGGVAVLGVQALLHRRHAPVPAPTA
jgi:Zn-dependent protease with chaperone function